MTRWEYLEDSGYPIADEVLVCRRGDLRRPRVPWQPYKALQTPMYPYDSWAGLCGSCVSGYGAGPNSKTPCSALVSLPGDPELNQASRAVAARAWFILLHLLLTRERINITPAQGC